MYIRVVSLSKLKELENKMQRGNWIVNYHADYCGHCRMMKPEWNKFVGKMKTNPSVNIADIENAMIKKMKNQPNIIGFPTIKFYDNGKELSEHNGERTCQGFEEFVNNNMGNNSTGQNSINDTLRSLNSKAQPLNNLMKLFNSKLKKKKSQSLKKKSIIAKRSIRNRPLKPMVKKTKKVRFHKNLKLNPALKEVALPGPFTKKKKSQKPKPLISKSVTRHKTVKQNIKNSKKSKSNTRKSKKSKTQKHKVSKSKKTKTKKASKSKKSKKPSSLANKMKKGRMNRKIGLNSSKSQQNIIQHLQNSLKEIKKQAHNDKKLLNNLTL